jgi:restriction system protein
MEYAAPGGPMPIPDPQALILPVLRQLADGVEHKSLDMRKAMEGRFELTPEELAQKQGSNSTTFVNNHSWALAWLSRARAIVKVRKGIYRASIYGIAILVECKDRQEITLQELRAFAPTT